MKEVSLSALKSNYRLIKGLVGRSVQVFPVVKARAYGHGAIRVAREFKSLGAEALVVAQVQEALDLKGSRISGPVIVMGGSYHGCEKDITATHGIIPVVSSPDVLKGLNSAAKKAGRKLKYHLKIDTGMHRLGLMPEVLAGFLEVDKMMGNMELSAVLTHLSSTSSGNSKDVEFTRKQLANFEEARAILAKAGHKKLFAHAANSGAIFLHPGSHFNAVRPGLSIYGVPAALGIKKARGLKPAMRVCARVVMIKSLAKGEPVSYDRTFHAKRAMKIAAVSMGYEDGVPRCLSGKGSFFVRGKRAKIVGAVTMDTTMVDVSSIPHASVGDEAVFIGSQDSNEQTAWDVANQAGTIPYEILCGIGERARLVYIK